MGQTLIEVISIYEDAIYLLINNTDYQWVNREPTNIGNDNIIKFLYKRRQGIQAKVGFSSPDRIERCGEDRPKMG